MKRIIFYFSLLVFLFFSSKYACSQEANGYRIKTVVIDAGHGGKDPGALYGKIKEKDVTLSIAKKLGNKIETEFPDVKVIYTRDKDVAVELYRRANIANKNHADLFISIHCNAAKSTEASGTETWVMGLHRSKENLEVAKLENASILLEDNYEDNYEGYDPNSPENTIIFSLFQNAYLDQSLTFASSIQENFANSKLNNRGIRQAGFLVLYKAAMPSVLIETGFLSNQKDRDFLSSENGKNIIAASIFKAFKSYKIEVETVNNRVDKPVVTHNIDDADSAAVNVTPNTSSNSIEYKVQFATSDKEINIKDKKYSKLKNISYYKQNGQYKYTAGCFYTRDEALTYRKEVIKCGFRDAFVVEFKNNNRIK
ncbi:MAG: N-acetylmuramoyl-L-alanine amidase [Bacteroidales bacterium]|jgi:N-acetylmuramoyl-L-alanine amidase|nr:N-acetylmuramoyl-L-alanine amidase [Bacteroidales bacterium]MDD2204047.1 N-acetylmuramoyl-L-alanine amidase [Bacteroidales bacterium]MDD3152138.1 N-acetylmuramoyl-L-alanine amidase [Bacteroidales bacterium]MDD3913365.1 N-acetylmuramoyl-L-alanine amidase [Bacteroidales bacterium]MDD4633160.1 N-acetylmuramoyl-L-alanine amidase [Bacteroidales bacterium]